MTTRGSHTPLFDPEITRGHLSQGVATPQPEPPPTYGDALVLTWDTRLVTTTPTRAVGFYLSGGYADIDWGDGSISGGVIGTLAHSYPTGGVWTCVITNTDGYAVTTFSMQPANAAQQDRLIRCDKFLSTLTTIAFYGCSNLYEVPDSLPSGITSLNSVFRDCGSINDPGISSWNVSTVVGNGFGDAFRGASLFNQPLDSWDVSGATALGGVFLNVVRFNRDLDSWDVSNVTTMASMFSGADMFNGDITTWDVSSVTSMSAMFFSANVFNQAIGGWDVSSVLNFASMFASTIAFNQPLGDWIVSQATAMESMFSNAAAFNQSIREWCNPNYLTAPTSFSGGNPTGWQANEKPSWGVCTTRLDNFGYISGGTLALNGDFLYVAGSSYYGTGDEEGTFSVIDVSDPDNPVLRGSVVYPGFYLASEMVNDGPICYVASFWTVADELMVVDATDPDDPVVIDTYSVGGTGLYPIELSADGNTLYGGDRNNVSGGTHLWIWDVTTPAAVSLTSAVNLTSMNNPTGICLGPSGYIYFMDSTFSKILLVDVTNPAVPVLALNTGFGVGTLGDIKRDATRNLVYAIAANDGRVIIFDDTVPLSPVLKYSAGISGVGGVGGFGVQGVYIIVEEGAVGIGIASDGRVSFVNTLDPTVPFVSESDVNTSLFNDHGGFVSNFTDYWTTNHWAISNNSVGAVVNRRPWQPQPTMPSSDFIDRVFARTSPNNMWACNETESPIFDWGTPGGRPLTVSGTPTYNASAISALTGPSISFSGTSHAQASTGVVSGAVSFSVWGWFKTTSTANMILIQQRDAAGFQGEWWIEMMTGGNAGKIRVFGYNTADVTEFDLNTTATFHNGVGHLVGLVVDQVNDRAQIWVDGVLQVQGGNVGGLYNSALNIALGRDVRDSNKNFVGSLSDFGITLEVLDIDDWEYMAGIT